MIKRFNYPPHLLYYLILILSFKSFQSTSLSNTGVGSIFPRLIRRDTQTQPRFDRIVMFSGKNDIDNANGYPISNPVPQPN